MPDERNDPARATVLQTLCELEQTLQRGGAHAPEADIDALLEATFREIGASGRQYTRESALTVLRERYGARSTRTADGEISELRCEALAKDVFLLTYLLKEPGRSTRRASLWRRHGTQWKILYHQGTPLRGHDGDD